MAVPKLKKLLTNPLGVTPGIARRIWIARKSDLESVPTPAEATDASTYASLVEAAADSEFVFVSGASFVEINGISDVVLDYGSGGEKGSLMHMPKLSITFQLTKDADGFRTLIANDEFITLFEDADENLRMHGNLSFPGRPLPGTGTINNTEKRLVVELEAGPARIAALYLPKGFAIPLTPAA